MQGHPTDCHFMEFYPAFQQHQSNTLKTKRKEKSIQHPIRHKHFALNKEPHLWKCELYRFRASFSNTTDWSIQETFYKIEQLLFHNKYVFVFSKQFFCSFLITRNRVEILICNNLTYSTDVMDEG